MLLNHESYSITREYTGKGRVSGGLIVFIKRSLSALFTRIHPEQTNGIYFIARTSRLTLFCFVYLPPETSVYNFKNNTSEINGVIKLSDLLNDIKYEYQQELDICIAGDLNSRIGGEQDFILDDSIKHVPGETFYDVDDFNTRRRSKDTIVNGYGRSLLELSKTHGVYTLNGRTNGDINGEFTYICHNGKSVIDYVLVSKNLFNKVVKFEILNEDFGSDHYPTHCELALSMKSKQAATNNCASENVSTWPRIKWNNEHGEDFLNLLQNDVNEHEFVKLQLMIDNGEVDNAVSVLGGIMHQSANKMVMKNRETRRHVQKQPIWWNYECEELKKIKLNTLNIFRATNSECDLESYKKTRSTFKNLCDQKKRAVKDAEHTIGKDASKDSLWKQVKSFLKKNNNAGHGISSDEWYNYFNELYNNTSTQLNEQFHEEIIDVISDNENSDSGYNDILDAPISEHEIVSVINDLNNNKAPGPDGIVCEMYKHSVGIIIPYILSIFNLILLTGYYPKEWASSIIHPIFKSGDSKNPSNYRGISLSSSLSKIFSKIVNNRLTKWCELNDKLLESQAGYRKGRSTIDHIFTLQSLIQKYLSKKNGRFYCLFVDFSKAYDSVHHQLIQYVLIKNDVKGKVFQVIKNMYKHLKSCVQSDKLKLTDYFKCRIGTKQGCTLSPLIFVLFLNELHEMMTEYGNQGIFVNSEISNIISLMYADDIANVSDTVNRLQNQINCIHEFCIKYGMQVNVNKTKISVFRRGGILKGNEKWFYGSKPLEVVSFYKYLGVMFTPKLCWSLATTTLAQQATKASNMLKAFVSKCPVSVQDSLFLFDRMILPILTYGCEIWGFVDIKNIENVHLNFCKFILHVNSRTSHAAVYGELGREPIYITYMSKLIKYWLKLLEMPTDRYPKACYNMLLSLDCRKNNVGK
ncbi:hypothetical protein SNE40_002826 [Patella caerulea]|uniref:Reverse transcriptase domain-containing protein n=1 Tax=Patella caerulea TaxID=87958 RepID=A0AAN8K1T9_PATCE